MQLSRRWAARSAVQRFDLYTRAPLYAISAAEPAILLLLVGSQPTLRPWGVVMLIAAGSTHTVCCLLMLRVVLDGEGSGRRPRARLVAATVGSAAVGLAAGPAAFPAYGTLLGSEGLPVWLAVTVLFCGATTAAISPTLRWRWLLVVVLLPTVLLGAAHAVAPALESQTPWALNYLGWVAALVLAYRSSSWVLKVGWEMDRGREAQSRLAVAEERLRVTRDVHDVLGRNLTLIAVNSELAARLVARDAEEAARRMLEVRATAQESMREVREVVSGERGASLDAELAGARSVLRSAGIAVRVLGDGAGLPPAVQTGLGWAVREATTNILRHADPTTVTIDLGARSGGADGPAAHLRVENDGIRRAGAGHQTGHGTGLDGLRHRLAQLGGEVTTTATPNGRFVLQARLPFVRPVDRGVVA